MWTNSERAWDLVDYSSVDWGMARKGFGSADDQRMTNFVRHNCRGHGET